MPLQTEPNDLADVMSPDPVALPAETSVAEAARTMKGRDVGDVIVLEGGGICGVVTDRDLVIRVLAEDGDPQRTRLGDICSRNLVTIDRDADVNDAIALMREHAIRRLPVTANGQPIGIVSLGDLAMMRDPDSALADISAAPANR